MSCNQPACPLNVNVMQPASLLLLPSYLHLRLPCLPTLTGSITLELCGAKTKPLPLRLLSSQQEESKRHLVTALPVSSPPWIPCYNYNWINVTASAHLRLLALLSLACQGHQFLLLQDLCTCSFPSLNLSPTQQPQRSPFTSFMSVFRFVCSGRS